MRQNKYRMCLIVEGNEEECFFEMVNELGLNERFELIIKNAHGYGNVAPYYQSYISREDIDCVLAVYDVDNKMNEVNSTYNHVLNGLISVLGEKRRAKAVSICTNPNILQIFLLGCDCLKNVAITSTIKANNSTLLEKYWPNMHKTYAAKEWQLDMMKNSYVYGTYCYDNLLKNLEELDEDYYHLPGSNILSLLRALKDEDDAYLRELIKRQVSMKNKCIFSFPFCFLYFVKEKATCLR